MPAVWQAIPATEFEVHSWDSQTVIFHKGTGDTHLFDELGWTLFQLLQAKAMDSSALMESLSAQSDFPDDDSTTWQVEELLEEMERLSLITNIEQAGPV